MTEFGRFKFRSVLVIAILLLVSVISLSGCSLNPKYLFAGSKDDKTDYDLSEDALVFLLGVYADEFPNFDLPDPEMCDGLNESIKQVGDHFALSLTKLQEEQILSYYENSADTFGALDGVEVLPDYKGFVITGDKSKAADIIANGITFGMFRDCAFRQLFGGVDCDDISVSIKVVDINSQKTLYEASWPQEPIELGVEDWDFSEESQ